MYRGQEEEEDEVFRIMFEEGIEASYFKSIIHEDFQQKSTRHFKKIKEQEKQEINEKTFRIRDDFKRDVNNEEEITKSGKCFKKQKSIFCCVGSKKTPYTLTLKNQNLMISQNNQIYLYINFQIVQVKIKTQKKSIIFSFDEMQELISFNFTEEKEVEGWMETMRGLIKKNTYQLKRNPYLASISNFYLHQYVLNRQFQISANTGDILLFRSMHSAARLQRVFTDSEYDHVGVVLRNKKNELLIYESSSGEGVGLTPWKHLVKYQWYKQVEKISWRMLNMEFKQKQKEIVEAFVAKTLGRQFEISLQKIFRIKSTLQRSTKEEKEKTYFCSQLVARLYKELGLLSSDRASSRYFPVDFSDKVNLGFLKENVSLSGQKLIVF